jgi:hypothetical protein
VPGLAGPLPLFVRAAPDHRAGSCAWPARVGRISCCAPAAISRVSELTVTNWKPWAMRLSAASVPLLWMPAGGPFS